MILEIFYEIFSLKDAYVILYETWKRLGCRFKANCPLVGPGHVGGVPSVGVILRHPSPYLREFRRKPRETLKGYVDKRDRGLNLALPSTNF